MTFGPAENAPVWAVRVRQVWARVMQLAALALLGCGDKGDGIVVGPFTGTEHRYVVDEIWLPRTNTQAAQLGDDLDGDGNPDNQFGICTSFLAGENDLTTHVTDMIAAGALTSSVVLRANDLGDDSRVGVWYFGADGDEPVPIGARIRDGELVSNRTISTRPPAAASVRLPVLVDADPVVVTLVGLEIDLIPDGQQGFIGFARGGIRREDVMVGLHESVLQMLAADPTSHLIFWRVVDLDKDGQVTRAEIEESAVVQSLTAPDFALDSEWLLGAGFQFHLSPCESGRCTAGEPSEPCHDRVLDGDETDIDCGGSCKPCPASATCVVASDCQARACNAGQCGVPSCNDGIHNGFETDVDCGSTCGGCAVGQTCIASSDCTTQHCQSGLGEVGTCAP